MIKGSTPTFTFALPFDASAIAEARISFGQDGRELVKKVEGVITMKGNDISCELTQRESLLFNEQKPMQIQLKVKTHEGKVLLTDIFEADVGAALNKEML